MDGRTSTYRLGSVGGVPVFVHVSWFFIAGLVLLGFWGRLVVVHSTLDRVSIAALAVLGTVLFFGSVLLHELAHALVARRRGIEVERITLYLFGGATEADPARRSAADEFTVAIVGPLTSVALAITFAVGALGVGVAGAGDAPRDLLVWLSGINLLLAVFNMAPGLPLDGGRVFRSTVWALTGDFARATRWATTGGVLVGFATMSVGLLAIWRGGLGGLWLVAIGWMISQSARQNEQQERLRAEFLGLVAADIMTSPVITIPADLSIAEAIRHYFSQRSETAFPVVDDSTIRGLLSVAAVRTVPPGELVSTTAGEVARRNEPPVIVGRATPMLDVIAAMAGAGRRSLRALVVEDGIVVGIISPSDVLRRDAIADLLEATSPTQ